MKAGFQAATARVQDMHQAIAGKTFETLLLVPGLAVPTRIVQGVHDAITQGVYAAVRHGGGAALALTAAAERHASDPQRVPGAKERALRSAINGAVGDTLAAAGDTLAVQMGLHAGGAPLPLSRAALAPLRPRAVVFLHGLACDEHSWSLPTDAWIDSPWAQALPAARAIQYGALLEHELDVSAIHVRYNSGLSIDTNAAQLAALLQRAAHAAPHVREWLLIGHSMGGLVARRAHEMAASQGLAWVARAPMIICLGSPHHGAPLAQLGHLAAGALNLSKLTRPLGRMADARSQGIKDLRHGLQRARRAPKPPALRLVFASLGDASDSAWGSLIGKTFGDGLVPTASAADAGDTGDVERVQIAGLGHMGLLNHPRVYAVIRRWLGAVQST
ncbi:MAG: hypothetical protein KGL99_14000 [Burkholderiales bacterium]|nr:hypothetical protein [Burkholderiales bacterium]